MCRRRRVLTVDDEHDVRLLCRANLEPQGFVVYEAANGVEALDLLARIDGVDVILLDVMMPLMDGWQTLTLLKSNPALAGIPVVMFSAWIRMSDKERSIDQGAVDFVEKPFSPSHLVNTVCAAMRPEH